MNIRREPTYLSTEVWRACWLLSKSKATEMGNATTPDEIADHELGETLKTKYPQLFKHQAEVARMEKELLKTL